RGAAGAGWAHPHAAGERGALATAIAESRRACGARGPVPEGAGPSAWGAGWGAGWAARGLRHGRAFGVMKDSLRLERSCGATPVRAHPLGIGPERTGEKP